MRNATCSVIIGANAACSADALQQVLDAPAEVHKMIERRHVKSDAADLSSC